MQTMQSWWTSMVLRHSKAITIGLPGALPNIPDKVERGPAKGGISSSFWLTSPNSIWLVHAAMLEMKGASVILHFYAKRTVQSEGLDGRRVAKSKGGRPPHPPGTAENAGIDVIIGMEYKREARGTGGHIPFLPRCF